MTTYSKTMAGIFLHHGRRNIYRPAPINHPMMPSGCTNVLIVCRSNDRATRLPGCLSSLPIPPDHLFVLLLSQTVATAPRSLFNLLKTTPTALLAKCTTQCRMEG